MAMAFKHPFSVRSASSGRLHGKITVIERAQHEFLRDGEVVHLDAAHDAVVDVLGFEKQLPRGLPRAHIGPESGVATAREDRRDADAMCGGFFSEAWVKPQTPHFATQ